MSDSPQNCAFNPSATTSEGDKEALLNSRLSNLKQLIREIFRHAGPPCTFEEDGFAAGSIGTETVSSSIPGMRITFVTKKDYETFDREFENHGFYKNYQKCKEDLVFYCTGFQEDTMHYYVQLCSKSAVESALKKAAKSKSIDSSCNTPEDLIELVSESLSTSHNAVNLSFPKFKDYFLCPIFGVNFPRLVTEIRLTGFLAPPQTRSKESKAEPEPVEKQVGVEEVTAKRKRVKHIEEEDEDLPAEQLQNLVLCKAPQRRVSTEETWGFLAKGFEDLSKGFCGLKLSEETLRGMMHDVLQQLEAKGRRGQGSARDCLSDEEHTVQMLAQEQLALLSSKGSFGDLQELADSIAKSRYLEKFATKHFKGPGKSCSGYGYYVVENYAFDSAFYTLEVCGEIEKIIADFSPHVQRGTPIVTSLGEEFRTVESFRKDMHFQLTEYEFPEPPELSVDEAEKWKTRTADAVVRFSHCHVPRMRDDAHKLNKVLFLHEVTIFIKSQTNPRLKALFSHPSVCKILCDDLSTNKKLKTPVRSALIEAYIKNTRFVTSKRNVWMPPENLLRRIRDVYDMER